ncbi:MAG: hypothetical protein MUC66_08555 [Methanolinea sp.]|nr:hypothetical protein [Methanolinea sp.]
MWIFGPQYADAITLPLQSDGSFGYTLTAKEIERMESGNYTVVFQSFGDNLKYDIALDERTGEVIKTSMPYSNPDRVLFTLAQAKTMRSAAPDALVRAIKETALDDGYAVYTFSIADPFIELDPVRDYYVGETITISGWTNFPPGENVFFEITRGFKDYGGPGDIVRDWRSVTVEAGPASINHFSADFNSSATRPGQHWVYVSSSFKWQSDVYTTFTLLEGPPPTTVLATTKQVVTTASPMDTATTVTIQPTTAPVPVAIPVAALGAVGIGGLIRRKKEE